MKKVFLTILTSVVLLGLSGCTSEQKLSQQIKKLIVEDPTILADAIKAHPAEFMEAVQEAAQNAKEVMAKKRVDDEKKKFEESFANPYKPNIRKDETIRGTKGAPLLLVEYSDFECPFCTRGYKTVNELLEKYKGKIQFVYKHLPLSFHQNAMMASQYYEAIRLQSEKKAFKFHDYIFENQTKLRLGEKFLKNAAKKAGANMAKLAKDYKSKPVMDRIKEDQAEAAKFGMQGTPGFLLNGIPVKGAYPASHFDKIVDKLKEKKLITL